MNSNTEHHQVKFSDISGKDWPQDVREFPPIRPSENHVVLYKMSKGSGINTLIPYKREHDRWDDFHVRMPHSKWNKYDKESNWTNWGPKTESRWALIEKTLEKMLKKTSDSKTLIKGILKYNGKFKDVWKFEALEHYLNLHLNATERDDFFKHTLPGIIKLALQLPDLVQAPIPLLKQNQSRSLSLSQEQIASLLANAFLCTLPWRNTTYANTAPAKLSKINFASLYESLDDSVNQKLRCICNYFTRVTSKTPTGVVTFSRRSVFECPTWESSDRLIESVPVYVDSKRKIEDATGLIQVDFANKYLGGGVLGSGLLQEEIRFLMCPELMASMIFTESLLPQEALMIIGCERYNDYKGYGHGSFKWSGDHQDRTPVDSSGRRRCAVLAIDAELYYDPDEQYHSRKIERDLNKAWIGFSFFTEKSPSEQLVYPGLATGNWGCGAFNGDPQLKCLIQMMAAATARRPLAYYTFGDGHFKEKVETAYELCRTFKFTVGKLFKFLTEYDKKTNNLFEKLTQYRSGGCTYPMRDDHYRSQTHHQGDQMRDNYNTSQTYQSGDQMREYYNTSQTHHSGDQIRDDNNTSQTHQSGDQMRDYYNTSQTHDSGDQMRDDYNKSQTHHQGDQIRDDHNRSQTHHSVDQMRDGHNRSQTHHQGDQITEHLKRSTPTYPHEPPQNLPRSSQNCKDDANHTPSNFKSSKNCGRRSRDVSEKYGKRSSQKPSSYRSYGGPSQSRNKMNTNNTQWRPGCGATHQGSVGNLTRDFKQKTQPNGSYKKIDPNLSYSSVLPGSARRNNQDSTNIYEATGNFGAVALRPAADGSAGPDNASDKNVS